MAKIKVRCINCGTVYEIIYYDDTTNDAVNLCPYCSSKDYDVTDVFDFLETLINKGGNGNPTPCG